MEAKHAISKIAQHLRPSTLGTLVAELEINETTLDNAVRVDAQVLFIRSLLFNVGLEAAMRFIQAGIDDRLGDLPLDEREVIL